MYKRIVVGLLVALALLVAVYWAWPTAELPPATGERYVDLHVHTAGIGAGGSGVILTDAIRGGYKFPFYLRAFDVTVEELESEGDAVIVRKLSEKIARSQRVSKAVVLALDGVYDEQGELDVARTQLYVPNEFLAAEVARYDNLLFGASINPHRKDWREQLDLAARNGAVLVKWIPAIMDITPSDESLIPFYDRLRELGIPLLTHAGQERSFGYADDRLGDPVMLELALKRGVTVIAAHIASTGVIDGQDNFDRLLPMFEKYDNLYADISALTQINRRGYLLRALAREDVRDRLVYGSDWPLQFFPLVSPWYQLPHVSPAEAKAIAAIDNQWDADVALKETMGVPPEIFRRTATLLGVEP